MKVEGGRKSGREEKLLEKMNQHGIDSALQRDNDNISALTDIMMKGRKEMQKQRLYKCCIDKIEFEMQY